MLVERKACCHVANTFLSRLELIWPISSLQISKMSKKNPFLAKSSRSQWVKGISWCYVCPMRLPEPLGPVRPTRLRGTLKPWLNALASLARRSKFNLRRDLRWVALVNKTGVIMKPSKHDEANKDVNISVGRSMSAHSHSLPQRYFHSVSINREVHTPETVFEGNPVHIKNM